MIGFLWPDTINPTSRRSADLVKNSNYFNINYLVFIKASVHVVFFPTTVLEQ